MVAQGRHKASPYSDAKRGSPWLAGQRLRREETAGYNVAHGVIPGELLTCSLMGRAVPQSDTAARERTPRYNPIYPISSDLPMCW